MESSHFSDEKISCLKIACKNGVKKGESIRQLAFLLLNIVAKVSPLIFSLKLGNHSQFPFV